VLAIVAAGCGGSRSAGHQRTGTRHGCPLSQAQRRDIVAAKREIRLMRKLEKPLKTVHEIGPPKLEDAVTHFLLDVGPLPVDVKSKLMDLGKAASALCHDCFNAIEAEEPVIQTRLGGNRCTGR
jgi:hypothetical protein